MTHLDYERQSPVWRHWIRELSRGRTLVRYDVRGCGLSDRQFEGMPTLDTYVGDLAAVVDAARVDRFALFGLAGGSPTAIEYAVRYPERVTHLVLYGAFARGRYRRGADEAERSRLLIDLMRVGWGGAMARATLGVERRDRHQRHGAPRHPAGARPARAGRPRRPGTRRGGAWPPSSPTRAS
jgi:pimeloyl-ACP methyl ester carboxylesterase